jgi:hypothetical protein
LFTEKRDFPLALHEESEIDTLESIPVYDLLHSFLEPSARIIVLD